MAPVDRPSHRAARPCLCDVDAGFAAANQESHPLLLSAMCYQRSWNGAKLSVSCFVFHHPRASRHGVASRCFSSDSSCRPIFLPGVGGIDEVPLSPDLGDGLGNCVLSRTVPDGLLGLRGNRQKLPPLGLAELGDGLPIAASGFGILNLPNAFAGSFIFSPNDSRTVRRADDWVDSIDRGEYFGGGTLRNDFRFIHGRAGG